MGLFKKNKKPDCFGISSKLSVECHSCNEKELCLDHINSRTSGTFCIPTNKPYPKHTIETKKPPKAVWTLKDARIDYGKLNPECTKCKFCTHEIEYGFDIYVQDRFCKCCEVKDIEIKNINIAQSCKYYTIK